MGVNTPDLMDDEPDEDDEQLSPEPDFLSTSTKHYAPDKPVTYGFGKHGVLWVGVHEVSRILGLEKIDESGESATSLHPEDIRTFAVTGTDGDSGLARMTTLAGLFLLITQSDTRPAHSIFIAWVTYVLIPHAHGTGTHP